MFWWAVAIVAMLRRASNVVAMMCAEGSADALLIRETAA